MNSMDSAMKTLNLMELEAVKKRYPNVPYPVATKHSDRTANGLTKGIIAFLRLSGHQAERISVTGRRIDRRVEYTDVLGHRRQIGSVEWIPSSMQKGTADISATINGKSVKIEVKIGRDRQGQAQKAYQQQVEAAGGLYMIATELQQFVDWYEKMQ